MDVGAKKKPEGYEKLEGTAKGASNNRAEERGGEAKGAEAAAAAEEDDKKERKAQEEEEEEEEEEEARDMLRGVSLEVPPGALVCVYGITGGGKSTLLAGLMGEAACSGGGVQLDGSVAFTAQKAWAQNATIEANIKVGTAGSRKGASRTAAAAAAAASSTSPRFSSPGGQGGVGGFSSGADEVRYAAIVEACTLTSDFKLLEHGDQTEIGEKGITLSGGQQQRVALARAAYADADVYLLDDPLSAVDAHVAKHLFDRCITDPAVLGRKTRVLVTHQVALTLPKADWVVVLGSGGVVLEQGSPDALRGDKGTHLNELLRAVGKEHSDEGDNGDVGDVGDTGDEATGRGGGGGGGGGGKGGSDGLENAKESAAASSPKEEYAAAEEEENAAHEESRLLVKEEERAVGAPSLAVYKAYFSAAGGWGAMLLISFFTVSVTGLSFVVKFTMATWVEAMEDGDGEEETEGLLRYLGATAASVFTIGLWILSRQVCSLLASRRLHAKMMERVIRAPVGWFDRTPLGRIQNRFSSDMQSCDRDVMSAIFSFFYCATQPVMSVFAIAGLAELPPSFYPVFLVVLGYAAWVAKRYLTTARELKRIQSIAKSPLYAVSLFASRLC